MHEMSIAQRIVEIALQNLPPDFKGSVVKVNLRVGEHAGVVMDSLTFCFDIITANTRLEGTRLDIESVPFVISCTTCGRTSRQETGTFVCPLCQSVDTRLESGTELDIVGIEIAEEGVSSP